MSVLISLENDTSGSSYWRFQSRAFWVEMSLACMLGQANEFCCYDRSLDFSFGLNLWGSAFDSHWRPKSFSAKEVPLHTAFHYHLFLGLI